MILLFYITASIQFTTPRFDLKSLQDAGFYPELNKILWCITDNLNESY